MTLPELSAKISGAIAGKVKTLLDGKQDKLAVTGTANQGIYVSASGVVSPMTYELNANVPANFAPGTAAPLMDGTAAVGTSAKYAHEDHRHDTDTSRASAADLTALVNYIKSMDVDRIVSGNPATFSDAKAASVKALSVTITPTQSGSGDPSPDNVRPISSVSSVTVTRTGKNLLQNNLYPNGGRTRNGVTYTPNSDGSLVLDGTSTGGHIPFANFADPSLNVENANMGKKQIPNGSYVISGISDGVTMQIWGSNYTSGLENFITIASGINGTVFTIDDTYKYNWCRLYVANRATFNNVVLRPMILPVSGTDATFEPYQGQTVTVTLTDGTNPLTVYGGTLDVTTGTLSVTHKLITVVEAFNGGKDGAIALIATSAAPAAPAPSGDAAGDVLCSHAAASSSNYQYAHAPNASLVAVYPESGRVTLTIQGVSDTENFNAFLTAQSNAGTPVQIVYRLAAPVTYQLTPQQLATLSGYNAVYSDAGAVDVTYKADPDIVFGGG